MIPRSLRSLIQGNHRNLKAAGIRRRPRSQRHSSCQPFLEALEDRTLPSVSLTNVPQWADQGPGPIQQNAQGDAGSNAWPVFNNNGLSIQAQVGAVESIAVEPVTASDGSTHYIVYAGTVNGGIWRAGFDAPSTVAQGTASVIFGAVTAVNVTNGGSGYTSLPKVVFAGGGGSGATAVATIANGQITSVSVTSPGTGYTSAPAVSFIVGDITPAMLTVVQPPGLSPFLLGDPTQIQWRPMSDSQPSLAISCLTLDPNDTSGKTVWAGTGTLSSFLGNGGPATGLLKTTDGGKTWSVLGKDLAGQTTVSVVPTKKNDPTSGKQIVLVADGNGVHWSNNGGVSFPLAKVNVNGVLVPFKGTATDLIADPNSDQRFYAAVVNFAGTGQTGVFESDNTGQNWFEIDNGTSLMTAAGSIKLAAQFNSTQTTLFAVTAASGNAGSLTGTFAGNVKPAGGGIDSNNWVSMGTPPSNWPSGWGNQFNHFTATADPSAKGVFYFATYQSAIVRVDPVFNATTGLLQGGSWTLLDKTASGAAALNGTVTHDDQRHLAFLGSYLLVANDGGMYGLETPTLAGTSNYPGRWVSLNSNLRDTEMNNAQYDTRNGQIFGGTQDNGTPFSEVHFGVRDWGMEPGGNSDGGATAMGNDHQYYSVTGGGNTPQSGTVFYDGTQVPNSPDGKGWVVHNGIGSRPLGASPSIPSLFILGSQGGNIYEITILPISGIPVITKVTPSGMSGVLNAITYGYGLNTSNANAVYFGTTTGQLWYRSSAGATFSQPKDTSGTPFWTGATPKEIAVDPYDSQTAYVLDSNGKIWATNNGGSSPWKDITGDLSNVEAPDSKGNPTAFLANSLTLCDPNPTAAGQGALVVGGGLGEVYSLKLGSGNTGWQTVGQGLPTVVVTDVHYIQAQDLLLVGTYGRGAWTLANASATLLTPPSTAITVTDDDATQNNIVIGSVPGFPADLQIIVNNRVEYTGPASNVTGITVKGSTAADTVIVGNGSLPRINGSIFISNPVGTTGLLVDDRFDPNGNNNIVLSSNSVSFSGYPSISWNGVNYLNVRAGTGGNNIAVLDTIHNGWTDLFSGAGSDTVTVGATSQTLDVHGAGRTTVKLSPNAQMLASLQGPLILDGGGSADFTLDDSTDSTATTYTITAATVRVGTLPSIRYNGLHKLTVNGGTSVDVYNVESTVAGTPVTITAAGFSNTVNVTPTAKELGLLQADLTINPGQVSAVILNDQNGANFAANPGPATYWLSSTVFFPPNSYVLSHGLKVQSSTASGNIYVNGPGAALYGSSLDDTYNVDSTPGPVSVNTGIGHNTVNVCPTTHATMLLGGDVTANGGGPTDVVINDQAYNSFGPAAPATYTVSSQPRLFGSQLRQALIVQNTNAAGSVIVAGAGSVTLNGLRGNLLSADDSLKDIYNVESTLAGMPVTLNTGTSHDTVNVGSDPVNLSQSILDPIRGAVSVNGAGGNTTLNFNDKGGTPGTTTNHIYNYSLARDSFSRTGTATVTFTGIATVNLNAANAGGSGVNALGVSSTALGTTTNVYAGTGFNVFQVFDITYTINGIQGPLNLHAPGGALPNDDLVQIYDVDKITQHTLVANAGATPQSGMVQRYNAAGTQTDAALISYDGLTAYATFYTSGSAGHTINVQSNASDLFTIIGTGATDTVNIGNSSHTLAAVGGDLRIQSGRTSVFVDDSGDTNSHTGSQSITLGSAGINGYLVNGLLPQSSFGGGHLWFLTDPAAPVTIRTGPGNDTFQVHDFVGIPALTLDGGGGTNTLDYSAFTGDVTVNLRLHTATGLAGISGIQNVIGSIGNDLLVGGGSSGRLVGGTGRNILISGAGGGTLDASQSTGDNVLIGGTTNYDTWQAALDAIFAEWTRTDLNPTSSYHVRFNDLGSIGLMVSGQLVVLNSQTVHANSAPDTLIGSNHTDPATGQRVHNWFFDDADDILVNFLRPDDHETRLK